MKALAKISGILVMVAGVGVGTSFIAKTFLTDEPIQVGAEYSIKVYDGSASLHISYYNYHKNGKGLFGTTAEANKLGYQKLGKYLLAHMYFGPEISQLREIVFGNRNIIGADSNGLYFPATKQIFINIDQYEEWTNNLEQGQNISQDTIFKNLTGVVVHEYGHHFINSYANSVWVNPKTAAVYQSLSGGSRTPQGWDSHFLKAFKKDLHYDTTYNRQENITNRFGTTTSGIESIANKYDPKTIFDNANSLHQNWGGKTELKYNFFTHKSYLADGSSTSTANLNYIYSMSELATRKLQQLMYKYPYKLNDIDNWARMVPHSLTAGNAFSVSTFVSDLMHNYVIIYNPIEHTYGLQKKDNKNLIYMEDNPWGGTVDVTKLGQTTRAYQTQKSTSDDLYQTTSNLMRLNQSVSQIYSRDLYSINSNGVGEYVFTSDAEKKQSKKEGYFKWTNNHIKLSGYLPEGKKYDGIVFGSKTKTNLSVPYGFTQNKARFNKKTSIFGDLEQKAMPSYYYMNKFVDLNTLKPESKIYWWKDLNNDQKTEANELIPFKEVETGRQITNYQGFFNITSLVRDKNLTFAAVENKADGLYLTKGGYHPWS